MSLNASTKKSNPATAVDSTALGRARDQNEAAQESIEQSAAELVIINAVLKQELPDHVQSDDVAMALEKNDALETRIQETASDLAEVNEALNLEITERAKLERELQATKDALAEATGEPPKT